MMGSGFSAGWSALPACVDAWLLTAALVLALPACGILMYRRLSMLPADSPGRAKLSIYLVIIALEWVLVGALCFVASRHALNMADLGERVGPVRRTLAMSAGLLILLALLSFQNIRKIRIAAVEELEKDLRRLKRFLPQSTVETAVFMVMALTAGICEELLYRGWLVNFIAVLTHSAWAGVAIGGVLFGLAHAYQGPKGIMATGVLGLVFGAIFVLSGSLFPGQILHAAIDAVNGLVGAYALKRLQEGERRESRKA